VEAAERTLGEAPADAASSASTVTAGDVAARLKSTGSVPAGEDESNEQVLQRNEPVPSALTLDAALRFLEKVGEEASEAYARAFREAALWMRTGRSSPRVKMAAREERCSYATSDEGDEKDETDEESE